MNAAIDVRGVLAAINVPTLLIHRMDDARVSPEGSRYLHRNVAGSRLVEIPGRDHPIWTGDVDRVADLIEEFLTGARPPPQSERVLAALLAARIVGAERLARCSRSKAGANADVPLSPSSRGEGFLRGLRGEESYPCATITWRTAV